MITIQQAFEQAMERMPTRPPYVNKRVVWVAYSNGEKVGKNDISRDAAITEFRTRIVEPICINEREYVNYWGDYRAELENYALYIWTTALAKEYSLIPSQIFEICYQRAREQSGTNDVYKIALFLEENLKLAEQIVKAETKNG